MKKKKIAISIDEPLLDIVDSYIDNINIRSRSQAIEALIKSAIKRRPITTAVILISEKDQKHLFKKVKNLRLIDYHINFLTKFGILRTFVITKSNKKFNDEIKSIRTKIKIEILNEEFSLGTAKALVLVKDKIKNDFIVINGDTFNNFDLKKMIQHHIDSGKIATIGLISSTSPHKRGAAILEGMSIIDFKEKQRTNSNVINAGIYIFKPRVFDYIKKSTKSIEYEIFPKLAKEKELQGYFTYGEFIHLPDQPF